MWHGAAYILWETKKRGLEEKAHAEWQRGRQLKAGRFRCWKVGKAYERAGQRLPRGLYFAVSPLLNSCFWMWLLLKTGRKCLSQHVTTFWPTHIGELETLRTYASVLCKQLKIDFSFAQHYVQFLFLNAHKLISCIHSFLHVPSIHAFEPHTCWSPRLILKTNLSADFKLIIPRFHSCSEDIFKYMYEEWEKSLHYATCILKHVQQL